MLPPHDCYVEVFGGAAWVLFAKEPSQVEIFNEIDGDIVNFFRVVKDKPDELVSSFDWDLVSREEFERLRDLPVDGLTDVERAHRFYYLIMAAWGAELGKPRFQTSVADIGHGNRLIGALRDLHQRILPAHNRLQRVIIEHLPWQECIARYDRPYEQKRVVMYLDPPYPNNNVNYPHNMRDIAEHHDLVAVLRDMQARFLLTIYDLPQVHTLYGDQGFYMTPVDFAAGMPTNGHERSRNRELIVTNYDPSCALPRGSHRTR